MLDIVLCCVDCGLCYIPLEDVYDLFELTATMIRLKLESPSCLQWLKSQITHLSFCSTPLCLSYTCVLWGQPGAFAVHTQNWGLPSSGSSPSRALLSLPSSPTVACTSSPESFSLKDVSCTGVLVACATWLCVCSRSSGQSPHEMQTNT